MKRESIIILVSFGILAVLAVTDGQHPCVRTCDGTPMVCQYDFTVEWYYTYTKACVNCTTTPSDCYRPQCITADGARRVVTVVNRQLPGPDIQVCKGDSIEVTVRNHLTGGDATTIHWHGIRQAGTPYMDGVSMVTQCAIDPASSFLYKFQVPDAGTYFWHAHSGLQRADGLFGSLIVRDDVDPHAKLYDYDLPEHVVIVLDWFHDDATSHILNHLRDISDYISYSILINGRGRFSSPTLNTTSPLTTFTVTKGSRYRFRSISSGVADCPIQISIDNHNLTLIASDGEPFKPHEVEGFTIYPGERYDFVLNADQPVGNYWFKARGIFECADGAAFQVAVLRYQGAPEVDPDGEVNFGNAGRPDKGFDPTEFDIPLAALRSVTPTSENISGEPDVKRYLAVSFNLLDLSTVQGLNPPAPPGSTTELTQINHITLMNLPVPALYQFSEIPKGQFCNEDTVHDCKTAFCHCIYMIEVKLGQLVELVFVDEGPVGVHPLHLHGFSFHVVSIKPLGEPPTTLEDVKKADQAGSIARNLVDPIRKDTITVPSRGYTAIRFRADNPGFWFLHCHLDYHVEMGMGLFVKVGEPSEWPTPPANWQHCGGDFIPKDAAVNSTTASSASDATTTLPTAFVTVTVPPGQDNVIVVCIVPGLEYSKDLDNDKSDLYLLYAKYDVAYLQKALGHVDIAALLFYPGNFVEESAISGKAASDTNGTKFLTIMAAAPGIDANTVKAKLEACGTDCTLGGNPVSSILVHGETVTTTTATSTNSPTHAGIIAGGVVAGVLFFAAIGAAIAAFMAKAKAATLLPHAIPPSVGYPAPRGMVV